MFISIGKCCCQHWSDKLLHARVNANTQNWQSAMSKRLYIASSKGARRKKDQQYKSQRMGEEGDEMLFSRHAAAILIKSESGSHKDIC